MANSKTLKQVVIILIEAGLTAELAKTLGKKIDEVYAKDPTSVKQYWKIKKQESRRRANNVLDKQ